MTTHTLPKIRPLSDLRTSIGEITAFVDERQAPVVLTKHGRGRYVLLGVEEYDELITRQNLASDHSFPDNFPRFTSMEALKEKLEVGLQDIAKGRTIPLGEAMQGIRDKHGL